MSYIPTFNINFPGGGIQQPMVQPSASTPIYSTYSGNLIGYGSIPFGTPTDAVYGQSGYGKSYHVIEYNPANGSHMAHLFRGPR